mmetsp:Transcript_35100/g.91883  ORF Transcript_35100/g.91883 Transcript_35100/m.91883 type:complete len:826 (-) Transcript_35100:65-2542(-)
MEYCDGGDLRIVVAETKKAGIHLPEQQIMQWLAQLLQGLHFVHSQKVLHRDLKSSNIFLCNQRSVAKIGDFGIGRVLDNTQDAAMSTVGTPCYMSPEVCRNEPYNWKSDVWSMGCILFEMCMLEHAFQSQSLVGLVYRIVCENHAPIPPALYPVELNELIRRLLSKSPVTRPTVGEVLSYAYVRSFLNTCEDHSVVPSPMVVDAVLEQSESSTWGDATARICPPVVSEGTLPPPPSTPPPAQPPPRSPGRPCIATHFQPAEDVDLASVLLVRLRSRRQLAGHWAKVFACFAEGTGHVDEDRFRHAAVCLDAGLSFDEAVELFRHVQRDGLLRLEELCQAIDDAPAGWSHLEQWVWDVINRPASDGKTVFQSLKEDFGRGVGSIPAGVFAAAVEALLPDLTEDERRVVLHFAPKSPDGSVDLPNLSCTATEALPEHMKAVDFYLARIALRSSRCGGDLTPVFQLFGDAESISEIDAVTCVSVCPLGVAPAEMAALHRELVQTGPVTAAGLVPRCCPWEPAPTWLTSLGADFLDDLEDEREVVASAIFECALAKHSPHLTSGQRQFVSLCAFRTVKGDLEHRELRQRLWGQGFEKNKRSDRGVARAFKSWLPGGVTRRVFNPAKEQERSARAAKPSEDVIDACLERVRWRLQDAGISIPEFGRVVGLWTSTDAAVDDALPRAFVSLPLGLSWMEATGLVHAAVEQRSQRTARDRALVEALEALLQCRTRGIQMWEAAQPSMTRVRAAVAAAEENSTGCLPDSCVRDMLAALPSGVVEDVMLFCDKGADGGLRLQEFLERCGDSEVHVARAAWSQTQCKPSRWWLSWR